MGCINDACIARMWNCVCCPFCDYVWTFGVHQTQAGASAGSPTAPAPSSTDTQAAPAGVDISKLFGELDRFCSVILAVPAAANHPEIKKQLEQIAVGKEKFKLAHAEQLARGAMLQGQFAALIQATKEKEEAQRKKIEERNAPSPPLDGDALGRALLKNLGFTS
jgi:hypothetical protein